MNKDSVRVIANLVRAGISSDDAMSLRRCAMTLHRWFELECGDSNNYSSWAIERDDNGDGPPFLVRHSHTSPALNSRTRIPDREAGARKRIAAIMAKYPELNHEAVGYPGREQDR